MSQENPPTIDPQAAARWDQQPRSTSPWLHEEVARRMVERLQWIKRQPRRWVAWDPVRGGLAAHAALVERFPRAQCVVVEPAAGRGRSAASALLQPWWSRARWSGTPAVFGPVEPGAADMVWANMALHMAGAPQALMEQWREALAPEGFLMFSCLGPDTLVELRALHEDMGWPPPAHAFTDMHDWGDMLVEQGFAEPVLDMERIVLTFASAERALQELRGLGRNLHRERFAALRGRGWHRRWLQQWTAVQPADGPRFSLTFEVIYGHAIKAPPRLPVQGETTVSLDAMRTVLRQGRDGAPRSS